MNINRLIASLLTLGLCAFGLLGVAPRQRSTFHGQNVGAGGGGGGGGSMPVLVNTAITGSVHNQATSSTASFNLASGNSLWCGIVVTHGATISSGPGDTAGNTFTQIGTTQTDGSNNIDTRVYYVKNSTSNSSDVVTITWNGGSAVWQTIVCLQYSGASTSSPLDASSQVQGTHVGSPTVTGSITVANNNTMVVGFIVGTSCGAPPITGITLNSVTFTDEANDGTNPCSGTTPAFVQSAWDKGYATSGSLSTASIADSTGTVMYNIFGIHP